MRHFSELSTNITLCLKRRHPTARHKYPNMQTSIHPSIGRCTATRTTSRDRQHCSCCCSVALTHPHAPHSPPSSSPCYCACRTLRCCAVLCCAVRCGAVSCQCERARFQTHRLIPHRMRALLRNLCKQSWYLRSRHRSLHAHGSNIAAATDHCVRFLHPTVFHQPQNTGASVAPPARPCRPRMHVCMYVHPFQPLLRHMSNTAVQTLPTRRDATRRAMQRTASPSLPTDRSSASPYPLARARWPQRSAA